jgi:single-strand DNA-binding protein
MASFNRVILMGNLTRDPQVKYIPSGTAVAELGLAVNRTWYDKNTNQKKEDVTFVDVTLWGRTAEIAGEYLSKGRAVLIEGRLQMDTWQDKETGQNRSKLKVVAENMTMVGGRNDGGGSGGGGGGGYQRSQSGGSSPMDNEGQDFSSGTHSPADSFYDAPGSSDDGGGSEEVPF